MLISGGFLFAKPFRLVQQAISSPGREAHGAIHRAAASSCLDSAFHGVPVGVSRTSMGTQQKDPES